MGYIQRFIFKITNFLFGKTKIFISLLAWFLIVTGVIFLIWPNKAREKIMGIGFGFIKGGILLFILYTGAAFLNISSRIAHAGSMTLLLLAIEIVLIVKLFLFLRKKTKEKLFALLQKVSVPSLRIFAVIQIVIGTLMLFLEKRIW